MAAAALCRFLNISAFLFLLLASLVYSLSFNLPDLGPNYAESINLYGDASISNQAIQVTPFEGEQAFKAGRAMYVYQLHLWDKASIDLADFTTSFTFNIDSDGNSNYGDGLAIFLAGFSNASDTSMTYGDGLGLMNESSLLQTAVDPFVAVVFDTYSSQPLTNVSINIGSTLKYVKSMGWFNDITKGKDNNALITYSSSSQILQVNFTGYLGDDYWTHSLGYKVDLRDHLPESVCIGFSAATGSFFEKHTVKSWQFDSTPLGTSGSTVPLSPPPNPPPPSAPPPNYPPPPNPPLKVKKKLNMRELIGLCIGVPIIVLAIGLLFILGKRKKRRRPKNVITLGKASVKAGVEVAKATHEPTLEGCAKGAQVPVEPTPECCVKVAEEPCAEDAEAEAEADEGIFEGCFESLQGILSCG